MSANEEPVSSSRGATERDPVRLSRASASPASQVEKSSRRACASVSSSTSASDAAAAPIRWPATVTCTPACGAERMRSSTASSTCSATVRPNRESHACGIRSEFSIVPTASPSARYAPDGFDSTSVSVSEPSSWESSSTATVTVFAVSPGAKFSVPEFAV